MDEDLEQIKAKKLEEMKKRMNQSPSEQSEILLLNQNNYASAVRNNQNLIVDFWAPWCGPCRMVAPVIEELSVKYAGKVRFAKCNTDENQQIAYQFGISAIPTLYFYRTGQLIHQVAGALPKEQFEREIQSVFQL